MNYKDTVCVVTGGANGIGRCIIESFIKEGAFVAFIDTDYESGMKLANKYSKNQISFTHGDITVEDVLINFSKAVLSQHKKINYLINNACVSKAGILSDCSYSEFNYVLQLGVSAPYMLTKLFLPTFADGGSIVNISSTRAYMSQEDTESYSAAKGGISALTHALSISLAGKVRVNSISPGWIDTGAYQKEENYTQHYDSADLAQHPAGRVGKPTDIADMVLYLCSDKAGFITGQDFIIDGGMTKQMIYHNDYNWTFQP